MTGEIRFFLSLCDGGTIWKTPVWLDICPHGIRDIWCDRRISCYINPGYCSVIFLDTEDDSMKR